MMKLEAILRVAVVGSDRSAIGGIRGGRGSSTPRTREERGNPQPQGGHGLSVGTSRSRGAGGGKYARGPRASRIRVAELAWHILEDCVKLLQAAPLLLAAVAEYPERSVTADGSSWPQAAASGSAVASAVGPVYHQSARDAHRDAERVLSAQPCLEAFRFLTAVPLPYRGEASGKLLRSSVAWFPLVGASLGSALVALDWLAERAFTCPSALVRSAMELAAYALLTGGLHHDALLDTADAFWGRRDREERLRIMRDSRAGALGVTALVLFIALELASLDAVSSGEAAAGSRWRQAVLLSFPVLGRWAMSYLCLRFPPARKEGAGAAVAGGGRPCSFLLATALALAALVLSYAAVVRAPFLIPVLMFLALTIAELLGGYFHRSLGGMTGDVIGATGMLCEGLLLLFLAGRGAAIHLGRG